VCSNGQDDDGDGMIDYPNDTACGAASGVSEACPTSEAIIPIVLPSTVGTTVGAVNDAAPTCGSSTNTAGDVTYSLTVPALTSLTISNSASFDAVGALYDSTCGGAALGCEDFDPIEVGPLPAGTYYYVLDGWSSDTGSFTIDVSGTIAVGGSCEGTLASVGALTCSAGSTCAGTMGARTCQATQCNDGADNDGDGITDYPLEPGCDSLDDNDETDPATPPVCGNGSDDDADGHLDYPADSACASASGQNEANCPTETDPVPLITAPTMAADLTNLHGDQSFSCQSNTGNDAELRLHLDVPVASLTIDTEGSTATDTVLALRTADCSMEVDCNDDSSVDFRSSITETNIAAGDYAVTAAGYSSSHNDPIVVNTHGTLASGTRCDGPLATAGVLVCDTGLTCGGTPATCH
jgi:hypothetical protein